jgi:chromosome segregation ATPase
MTHPVSAEVAVGQNARDVPNAVETRVLVRKAALEIEVEKVSPALTAATALTTRLGGYVESSAQRSEGSARLVLRVPSMSLDATLDSLARIGKVESRSITATDVTEQARDLDARVITLRATRDRLRQLLDRATSVSDIAAVETQLSRVQQDLDSLEGRLKSLRTDVALSELTLDIQRRHVLGPLGLVVAGLGWVVEKLFILR